MLLGLRQAEAPNRDAATIQAVRPCTTLRSPRVLKFGLGVQSREARRCHCRVLMASIRQRQSGSKPRSAQKLKCLSLGSIVHRKMVRLSSHTQRWGAKRTCRLRGTSWLNLKQSSMQGFVSFTCRQRVLWLGKAVVGQVGPRKQAARSSHSI